MEKAKPFLRPIKNTSVVQQVINRITKAMIDKQIRPGDKIPTEMEMAEVFGVGRNSIREAIKILVSFGVLEIRRPEGTFVTKGFTEPMIDPLIYGIILDEESSMESLKELREWVDVGIMHFACLKATEEDIKVLEAKNAELEELLKKGDIQGSFDADDAFHAALAGAAHNPIFAKVGGLVRTLTSAIRLRTVKNMIKKQHSLEMFEAHAAMVHAVKNRAIAPNEMHEIINHGYFYEYGSIEHVE